MQAGNKTLWFDNCDIFKFKWRNESEKLPQGPDQHHDRHHKYKSIQTFAYPYYLLLNTQHLKMPNLSPGFLQSKTQDQQSLSPHVQVATNLPHSSIRKWLQNAGCLKITQPNHHEYAGSTPHTPLGPLHTSKVLPVPQIFPSNDC